MQTTIKSIQWVGTPEERIVSTRKFRQYVNGLDFSTAIEKVKQVWMESPTIVKEQFNIMDESSYPSPWDLFSWNFFSPNAKILGMFYTLLLSNHSQHHDIWLGIAEDMLEGERAELVVDFDPRKKYTYQKMISKYDLRDWSKDNGK
ncbi:Uncharacterised protein [uncultured archaeon]|nr:Uncharacterised protein [uncultured archaeon]